MYPTPSRLRSAMDDSAGEAGGQSQVHACSSYPLSFPSQPPDIKNWFSSYVYDSPEVPELVADHDGGNGSETQDPFEHSPFKHSLQDGEVASRENCLGGQSEPETFSGKYLVPVDGDVMKPAPKRKQSLRALFGVSFLDDFEEANETESHGLSPVQLNALKHVSDCTSLPLNEICEAHSEKKDCTTNLPDTTRHSQEGTIEHSKVLVDCDCISSVDTQECTPADQEVESKKSANCDDARFVDIGKGFAEDVINHIELPVSFNSTIPAGTEKKIQDCVDNSTSLVSRNSSLADTDDNSPLVGENDSEENSPLGLGRTDHCRPLLDSKKPQEIVASDGFIAVKRKEKQPEEHKTNKLLRNPMGREKEKEKLQENGGISDNKVFVQEQTRCPLADRTNFSEVNAPPAPEPSRKWKCPRKGKPYVGRPMKQLRLEQWVRRVN